MFKAEFCNESCVSGILKYNMIEISGVNNSAFLMIKHVVVELFSYILGKVFDCR